MDELKSKNKFYIAHDTLPVQTSLDDKGYTKISYKDLADLEDKNNIIVWSQSYSNLDFTKLMKQSNNKRFVFNHHPHVTKICYKLNFHSFVDEYKIMTKNNCDFLLPT